MAEDRQGLVREHPSVSVVLPVFINKDKNIADTHKCISLLRSKTKVHFELVIVETCSSYFIDEADVYIYEKVKTNCTASINRAFKCCNTDYVVFVGNDVFVDDGWLEALIDVFASKSDAGIATLGNTEHSDIRKDQIVEEIFFSICMLRREDAWFDPFYKFIFDDTDLILRIYLSGRKSYKNLSCIVTHVPHQTYGKYCGNPDEYERSKQYFIDKYSAHRDHHLYKKFSAQ